LILYFIYIRYSQINSIQIDNTKLQEQKRKRRAPLPREEIPMKNRSVSRSTSTGTITDEIQDTLHSLLRTQKQLERDQRVTNDWRALATKVDKILFYFFLLITIVSTMGLLVGAPFMRSNLQQKTKLWNGSRRP